MHRTVAANLQHRVDEATGRWTRAGKGVYENYDGWKIAKGGKGWVIFRPDGSRADIFSYSSLIVAKYEVDHNLPTQNLT